jgi:hypothetical protein
LQRVKFQLHEWITRQHIMATKRDKIVSVWDLKIVKQKNLASNSKRNLSEKQQSIDYIAFLSWKEFPFLLSGRKLFASKNHIFHLMMFIFSCHLCFQQEIEEAHEVKNLPSKWWCLGSRFFFSISKGWIRIILDHIPLSSFRFCSKGFSFCFEEARNFG